MKSVWVREETRVCARILHGVRYKYTLAVIGITIVYTYKVSKMNKKFHLLYI